MKALMIIIPAAIAIFVIMLPDIFPQCYVCGEKKVRPLLDSRDCIAETGVTAPQKSVCENAAGNLILNQHQTWSACAE